MKFRVLVTEETIATQEIEIELTVEEMANTKSKQEDLIYDKAMALVPDLAWLPIQQPHYEVISILPRQQGEKDAQKE